MNASRTEFLDEVFVLDEEELRKLIGSLLDFAPALNISIKCSDKLERKLQNIEDLLQFENSPSKEILSLRLSGLTDKYERSVTIEFENKKGASVYLNLDGPEDSVLSLSSALQDRLTSVRPWYAFFAQRDAVNVVFAFLGLSFLGLVCFVAFNLLTGRWNSDGANTNDPKATMLAWLIIIGILFVSAIAVFLLNRTQRALFPIGVFAIGQGKKRNAKKEWLRTSVVVAFVISVVAGIVVLIITIAIQK